MPAAGAVAEPAVVAGEAVSEAGTLTLVLTSCREQEKVSFSDTRNKRGQTSSSPPGRYWKRAE